jgi:hypothetical protein
MRFTKYRLIALIILLVALGLRLWQIDRLPPGFHFDESFEGLEAWRILTDPTYRPLFLTGNFGVPPLNAYANALTFALVQRLGGEAGPMAMRVTAALFGVLGVLAVYALAHELVRLPEPRIRLSLAFPLLAAATLALMRWHLHFSRMGIEPVIVPLIWASATWLLLHGWRTGQWISFVASGGALAAGMYTYQGAWVIPWLILAVAFDRLVKDASVQDLLATPATLWSSRPLRGLLVTGLVAFLLCLPLGWFFWQNPTLLLLRPSQIVNQMDGANAARHSLWQALWATAKMFGPLVAPGDFDPRRNLPGAPALNVWLALPFYLGLGVVLWRIGHWASRLLLVGLVGLLLPGVFSEYAPHFHRILGAAAPTALICALGLDWLWQAMWQVRGRTLNPGWQRSSQWVAVCLLVLGGITSVRDYFVRWAALPDLFYAFDVGIWQLGNKMATLPADAPLYLSPRSLEHPTLAFALQRGSMSRPALVSLDGGHLFPVTAQNTEQAEFYAVIEHEDFRTRLLLPEVFPMAYIHTELLDAQGQLYARIYERPAGVAPVRLPQQAWSAVLGDGIRLLGYDVQPTPLRVGELLYLQLHWLVDAPPLGDWTVFTHVLATDAAGAQTVVAGQDDRPGRGSLPTTQWQAGWRILDEYQIALPAELPAGEYALEIGLYQSSGEQLPAERSGLPLEVITVHPK